MWKINACFYLLVVCEVYPQDDDHINDQICFDTCEPFHIELATPGQRKTLASDFLRKFTKRQSFLYRLSSPFQGLSFYFVSSRFNLEPNCRMKLLRRERNPWRVVFSYCTMRNTLWIPEKVRLNLVKRFILYNAMRNTLYLPRFWWSMESQKK